MAKKNKREGLPRPVLEKMLYACRTGSGVLTLALEEKILGCIEHERSEAYQMGLHDALNHAAWELGVIKGAVGRDGKLPKQRRSA